MASNHNHFACGGNPPGVLQDLNTAPVGEKQVGNHQLKNMTVNLGQSLFAGCDRHDRISAGTEQKPEGLTARIIVVNQQYADM